MVIGCGYPKTGIGSLCAALTELGFASYNDRNLRTTRHHIPLWHQAAALKAKKRDTQQIQSFAEWNQITFEVDEFDWNRLFQINTDTKLKYNAIIGGAATPFYLDIMRFYENQGYDVRIILTYKSEADLIDISESNFHHNNALQILDEKRIGTDWYSNTDWIHRPIAQTMGLTVAQKCIGDLLFGDDDHGLLFFDDEENCKLKYKQWIDSVIEHVPEERLSVFNVANGYEPLCQFLDGLHVPQYVDFEPKPFPRVNCHDTPSVSPFRKLINYFL